MIDLQIPHVTRAWTPARGIQFAMCSPVSIAPDTTNAFGVSVTGLTSNRRPDLD